MTHPEQTPRTNDFARSGDASAEDWTDFARQLERELLAAQAQLEAERKAHDATELRLEQTVAQLNHERKARERVEMLHKGLMQEQERRTEAAELRLLPQNAAAAQTNQGMPDERTCTGSSPASAAATPGEFARGLETAAFVNLANSKQEALRLEGMEIAAKICDNALGDYERSDEIADRIRAEISKRKG